MARLQNGPSGPPQAAHSSIRYGMVALGVRLAGARRQLGATAGLRLCKGSALLPMELAAFLDLSISLRAAWGFLTCWVSSEVTLSFVEADCLCILGSKLVST